MRNFSDEVIKKINPTKIRNFSIIAHIDHGKSTLADRLLEKTNLKGSNKSIERILDSLLPWRGITIKLNAVQLYHPPESLEPHIFNLIDTPGHVDFMYEVSRSLAACEGVLLLVDATKGIQAQTLAYYEIAKSLDLKILPIINKIDLPSAQLGSTKKQLIDLLACQENDICLISAKSGQNIDLLLNKIIEVIPAPIFQKGQLKALVFDLLYSRYYGVIVYLKIIEGELTKNQKIKFHQSQKIYQVERVGVKTPKEILKQQLTAGEIGWFTANIRDMREVKVGDTVFDTNNNSLPLEGYQEVKSNVYSNLYPTDTSQYKEFKKALEELQIQDSSLSLETIDSQLLGPGFRCGFLGLLHREIVCERVKKEYNCEIITTPPSVTYRIICSSGEILETNNPQKIPSKDKVKGIEELFILLNITTPEDYLGPISQLCQDKRGVFQSQEWKTGYLYNLIYHLPFAEFILDFHDKIKSISHGYASFSYQIIGFRSSNVVKIDILLNEQIIPDLSFLVYQQLAYERAKIICERLKETLNQQTFTVPIQACIGNQVIARETLPALKKHVTGNMYGGDRTRKMKLWSKQKKGQKIRKEYGKVNFDSGSLRRLLKGNK